MQNKKVGIYLLLGVLFFVGSSLQGMDQQEIEKSEEWKDEVCRAWKRSLEDSETECSLAELFAQYDLIIEGQEQREDEKYSRLQREREEYERECEEDNARLDDLDGSMG